PDAGQSAGSPLWCPEVDPDRDPGLWGVAAFRSRLFIGDEPGRLLLVIPTLSSGVFDTLGAFGDRVVERLVFKDSGQWGHVAEWLRNGLQNRVLRFNSGRGLHLQSVDFIGTSRPTRDGYAIGRSPL